ncbi:tripartite motif-containing protein 45 [Ixodes scapularis]
MRFSFNSISTASRLDLLCAACQQRPQDPRILPCLHTLCRHCFERLAVADASRVSDIEHASRKIASVSPTRDRHSFPSSGYSSSSDFARGEETAAPPRTAIQLVDFATRSVDPRVVVCPACKTQTALTGPPIQLPPNTLLTRFLDGTPGGPLGSRHGSASRQPASRSKRSSFCDLCTKTTSAVNRCIICVLSLCSFCTRAHRRQRKTNSHNLMSLQDSCGPTVGKDTEVPRQTYCPTHSKCVLNTFCQTCKKTACDQCILYEHKDHIQNDVNVAKEEELKRTSILLTRLRWKMSRMESSASGTLRNSQTLERNVSSITREVNLFYDGYVEALEARRRDLLEEIAKFRRENENTLRTRKDSLDAALVKARQIHDFGKTLLHFGPEMPEVVLPLVGVLNKGAEPIVSDEGTIEDNSKTLRTLRFCKNGESAKGQYRIYGAVSSENWPSKTSAVLSFNAGSMARRENPVGVAHLEFRDSSGHPTCVEPEQVQVVLTSATSRRLVPYLKEIVIPE